MSDRRFRVILLAVGWTSWGGMLISVWMQRLLLASLLVGVVGLVIGVLGYSARA